MTGGFIALGVMGAFGISVLSFCAWLEKRWQKAGRVTDPLEVEFLRALKRLHLLPKESE